MPMLSAIRLHTSVHLTFMRRNRILLGFTLLITLGTAILLVPGMLVGTTANRFAVLQQISVPLHMVVALMTAGLGLLMVWSHRRARSIKMVATTPSSFDAWVVSVFLSAAIVGAVAHAIITLTVFVLSTMWHVPYQYGFLFLPLVCFVDSLIGLAAFTLLSAMVHPVLAVLLVVIAGEQTTQSLWQFADAGSSAGAVGPGLRGIGLVARTLYYVMPTFWPYADRMAMSSSMRVPVSDWRHLETAFAYALLVCACSVFSTIAVLRSKQLT
jgi:hypothetical protein